jgi:hypothetical protein
MMVSWTMSRSMLHVSVGVINDDKGGCVSGRAAVVLEEPTPYLLAESVPV